MLIFKQSGVASPPTFSLITRSKSICFDRNSRRITLLDMSLKEERDLNPTSRNQVNRAKTAAQSKNYDYAITLLQATLKDEPLFLEGRRLLRAVEIQKFKSMSTFTRQMTGMRLSGGLKMSSAKKTPQEQLVQAEELLAQDPYHPKANV